MTIDEKGSMMPIDVVVRSQIDAYDVKKDGSIRFLLLKTFNKD
jgi:hypothetical protein